MKTKLVFLSILISSFFTSCSTFDGINGEGPVKSKQIETINDFNQIKISRGLQVELTPGDINKALIKADENLLEVIKVYVEDNVLIVTSDKNIRKAKSKKVFITFNSIEKLTIHSGSSVSNKGFIKNKNLNISVHSGAYAKLNTKSDFLRFEVHSGSKVDLDGFCNNSDLQAHSGAHLNARNLQSKNVTVQAHSGAHIKLFASESINGQAHSGASIKYAGNPKNVSKKAHSGGHISKI